MFFHAHAGWLGITPLISSGLEGRDCEKKPQTTARHSVIYSDIVWWLVVVLFRQSPRRRV